MSATRNVSTPLELHQLNLVNKSKTSLHRETPPASPTRRETGSTARGTPPPTPQRPPRTSTETPKQQQQQQQQKQQPPRAKPRLPVLSPKKPSMQPPASQRQDPAVDDQLLYTLAAKQREMSELESRMAVLRKEVAELESQVCESRGYRPEGNGGAGLPRDPVKLAEIATTTTNRLWRGLVDKFNEFNVAEDEFDDKQKKDRRYKEYYIKEAYDFDEDEIEEESRKEMSFARGKPRREAPESSTHRM